ncbi:DNA alkylation repair protein [Alistipes sp.]|uniref:DNA alkylation repair protein n=1 Tax=Alistipes sp. TaxID=1872444 RepID=UPI003AEF90CE
MTLREQLIELADPGYRNFVCPLMPGVSDVLGVRLPQLRRLAREIARGEWRAFAEDEGGCFEERMLRGMVIGCVRVPVAEKLELVARFVPQIDNWSVCDSFCWTLRRAEREPMWHFIQPYFHARAEYDVRFAVVTALRNFIDEEHLEALLTAFDAIRHEGYYARMAVAWAVSMAFVRFPERTLEWLGGCRLDDWTYDKSRQKIVESLRVDDRAKQTVRAMKRPAK